MERLWRLQRKIFLITLGIIVICIAGTYFSHPTQTNPCQSRRIVDKKALEIDPRSDTPIRILSWTGRSSHDNQPWYSLGTTAFDKCQQHLDPSMQCTYTNNRDELSISDAILFRGRHTTVDMLPPSRLPHQNWIFFEFEPPYKMMTNLTKLKNVFNLTSTYSFSSDIPLNVNRRLYKNPVKYESASKIDFAKNKTKLVAWFVSVCKTQSKREKFVEELQKYIPVDIYGGCGTLRCGRSKQSSRARCDRELLDGVYKFYLSFENSLCRDYVTEKLWRVRGYNVIQLLMGAVDYKNYLPAGTFIDIRDFKSAKALADYMLLVNSSDTLFNEYMWNKKSLEVQFDEPEIPYLCRLCRYLHQHRGRVRMTHDIASFWSTKTQCITPDEYFRS